MYQIDEHVRVYLIAILLFSECFISSLGHPKAETLTRLSQDDFYYASDCDWYIQGVNYQHNQTDSISLPTYQIYCLIDSLL